MKGSKLISILAGLAACAASGAAHAIAWYFQTPASKMAQDIDILHQVIMWIILVIFVGVFSFMFYACYAHRKSIGHKAAQFHENTTVELLWTVIPALILVIIAWPVTKVVIAQKDTSAPDLTIKVTGYQWKWGYDYLRGEGEGISFVSTLATPRDQIEGKAPKGENYLLEVDNEMVVPVGKKIRVITTAGDVVHAWWIPALGAKQDAIPGFLRDTWFRAEQTGTYRGQCTELCGKEHAYMPIVVRVVPQDQYTKWVGERKKVAAGAEAPAPVASAAPASAAPAAAAAAPAAAAPADDSKPLPLADLVSRGEKIYAANCVACHQATGQGMPAIKAPALAGNKLVTGAEQEPIDTVLNGRPNTAMQPFRQQLSDAEIAAVITYMRNSWGNKASEVQPAEVKARRK
ncbi:MAG TPA: cytochrome c oxidase subunit II [Burkholderiales bacterium]|jgi:cytochrome c oxidase subunit 2|nr:cytochrome c oxidase subunit II [Burkholderiales bacterium]